MSPETLEKDAKAPARADVAACTPEDLPREDDGRMQDLLGDRRGYRMRRLLAGTDLVAILVGWGVSTLLVGSVDADSPALVDLVVVLASCPSGC